jgi:hypothetical protein
VITLGADGRNTGQAVVRASLVGANPAQTLTGEDELAGKSNYFTGSDPAGWKTGVANYSSVRYADVYSGIDQIFYGNGRQLEFDFVVSPTADPRQIAVQYSGIDRFEIGDDGDLVLTIGGHQLIQKKPVAYQTIDGVRNEIAAAYSIRGNSVGFELGDFDRSKELVIDPVLTYSTYLGGIGFDQAYAIAVDAAGNAYVTGRTGTTDFPTTAGAFDRTINSDNDAFVTNINAAGTALVYSTYIGGAIGNGIAVDAAGNAYVTGEAGPPAFPTTPGAFQTTPWGFDAFILKLNASGSSLIYSSRFGGDFDDFSRAIAIDAAGNAYITGWTECRAPTCSFPLVNAFQPNYAGGFQDAFVSKLNASGTALVYSTYLGGGQVLNATEDWGEGIAVDSTGSAYVTGYTYSPDFPVTAGAYDTTRCGLDAFVTKFTPAGSSLAYSTFFGGCGREQGMGIAVDSSGRAYVAGITESQDMPTTAGAFQTSGSFDAFVTKFNATGSGLIYSTYLGGTADVDRGWEIAIDGAGNAFVTGDTKSPNFPVLNASQATYGGGLSDAFVSELNATGSALLYSSFLGGNLFDEGRGVAVDTEGNAYLTGDTSSYNFPVTGGAFQPQNAGGLQHHDDAYVAKVQGQTQPQVRRATDDFDGDGKTDLSIFRPADGKWYLYRSTAGVAIASWGNSTDIPVAADYDNDGKTDIAVFRPSTGYWYIYRSSEGSVNVVAWGVQGDKPVAGDYDGDGKADIAIFRPTEGNWYVYQSSAGVTIARWGASTDLPVAGDYDGDGKFDLAVFRPSTGQWLIFRSFDRSSQIASWGASTDRPVPADYDGDSKQDLAVYRPSTGAWYIYRSANATATMAQWGNSTDVPVPGDYDGDGKSDYAIFRNGAWYVYRSTAGGIIANWGASGDIPIPSTHVP